MFHPCKKPKCPVCEGMQNKNTISKVQCSSNKLNTIAHVGVHFRLPGDSLCDLQLIPIEKINSKDTLVRKVCEKYLISKFDAAYKWL